MKQGFGSEGLLANRLSRLHRPLPPDLIERAIAEAGGQGAGIRPATTSHGIFGASQGDAGAIPTPPSAATQRRRPNSLRLGLTTAAAVAVAAATFGAIVVTSGHQGSAEPGATHLAPLANTALTPSGWSPVELGAVQISVPSDWAISDGYTCVSKPAVWAGVVFINQAPLYPANVGCATPTNVVEMGTASQAPLPDSHPAVINSIPVSEASTASASSTADVIRALGVEIDINGPLTARIVGTLTHSPLSVVLDSSINSVPASWRQETYGGIQFAVPGQWRVQHQDSLEGCLDDNVYGLVLNAAEPGFGSPSCGGPPSTGEDFAPNSGMLLAAGPQVSPAPAGASCLSRNNLRICVDPASFGGLNQLIAQITVPNQSTIDSIEIGLTGTGLIPLQIFDSMRPSG